MAMGMKIARGTLLSFVVASRLVVPISAASVGDADAPQFGDPVPDVRRSEGQMRITGVGGEGYRPGGCGDPSCIPCSTMPSFLGSIEDLNVIGDDLDHHSVTGRNVNSEVYRDGEWLFGHYGDDGQWVNIWGGGPMFSPDPSLLDPITGMPLVGQSPAINVWGRVIGEGLVTYSIDIEWGNMTFVYDFGVGADWNPDLLSYGSGVTSGQQRWLLDNYFETVGAATRGFLVQLPGETIANNEVRVTNRSNAAVAVWLGYDMNWITPPWGGPMGTEPGSNLFNDNIESQFDPVLGWEDFNNSTGTMVVGAFYDTIVEAQIAATISSTFGMMWGMTTASMMSFPSAVGFGLASPTDPVNPALIDSRFFAFSGVPDPGRSVDLAQFTNVGRITVDVLPIWEGNTP